jgi:hypothetical protein
MSSNHTRALALHVGAAKRLLQELEEQAEAALHALGRDNGAEFFAVVDDRDRILGQLDKVVSAITKERGSVVDAAGDLDPDAAALLAEMAQIAATALESHAQLIALTRRERDRLAVASNRASRPSPMAKQYSALDGMHQTRSLSVTG